LGRRRQADEKLYCDNILYLLYFYLKHGSVARTGAMEKYEPVGGLKYPTFIEGTA
jgi:hypothetical protein